jgi:Ser-tRNA(Ala) deacylase AlaX
LTTTIFNDNPYLCEFSANIIGITESHLVLDRTAFCPATATWPGDVGSIGLVDVVSVKKGSDGDIWHEHRDLSGVRKLKVGDAIDGRLNWARRHRIMRLLTATLLVEHELRERNSWGRTERLHCDPDRARVEIGLDLADRQLDLAPISRWIETLVAEDVPIGRTRDAGGFDRWFSHLDGMGVLSSGGVLVKSTGEIGAVDLELSPPGDRSTTLVVSVQ